MPSRAFSFSTPLPITVAGRTQIVSAGSDVAMAVDAEGGKEVWRVRYPGGYSLVPKPVFGHGLVYICTGYGTPILMAVRPDGSGDVTATHVAWSMRKNVPHSSCVLLVGDDLYMVSDKGVLSCLDAKAGEVRWTERVGGEYTSSPVLAGGHVYLTNEAGTVTVFKPGGTFQPVAANKLGERSLSSPAIDGDAIYFRTAKHLYKFESK